MTNMNPYLPFASEILEVIRHYADTLGQFRAGMCCIPVLRMTCDDQPEGR